MAHNAMLLGDTPMAVNSGANLMLSGEAIGSSVCG
jgi:hypothetical protein